MYLSVLMWTVLMNAAEDCDVHVGKNWMPNKFCSIVTEQEAEKN